MICENIKELQSQLIKQYGLEQLWLNEKPDYIEVNYIKVPKDKRKSGIGTAVIKEIQKYAQDSGKKIILLANPEKRKKSSLNRFYNNLGFKRKRSTDYSLPSHTHTWDNI